MKNLSLATVGNSIVGVLGGGIGGYILGMLGIATGGGIDFSGAGDMAINSIIGSIAGGVLLAVVVAVKKVPGK